jgi:DNA polymerase-3 subunit alpha
MRVQPSTWTAESRSFLGIECTPLNPRGDLQLAANEAIIKLSRATGLPLLMTTDAHFVRPADKIKQDIGLDNSTGGSMRFSTSYHHPSTQEAWANWSRRHDTGPEGRRIFTEAIENNYRLVSMAEPVVIEKRYHLPPVEVPPDIRERTDDEDARLEAMIMRRVAEYGRMPGREEPERRAQYAQRLAEEMRVIARNGKVNFLPYFLTLHDVCRYARDNNILTGPGRGSAAGSLLSYLLCITHLDPIRWNLSFARFLSMGRINRGKLPDIDLDFGDPGRIAAWLKEVHGDRFVRVCTTGTLRPKSAIKDAARVLLDTQNNAAVKQEVEDVCKTVPNLPQGMENMLGWMYGYEDNEGAHVGHVTENSVLAAFLEKYPQVKSAVDDLLGLPRSMGRHASGFCLSDIPVSEIVPTCIIGKTGDKETCTQFTKDQIEELGLIKMDLLGLNTLKDIAGCLELVKQRHGVEIDIYNMPEEDQATFDAFCEGRNETVFQFNSSIATNLCRQVQPRCIDDLSQITANGRPGTMYAKMEDGVTTLIDAWIARRQGKSPVTYVHPDLEEILRGTSGIFVFQEEIAAAFVKCCGYTEEQADEIREIVGKKKKDKMDKILPDIRERLAASGWNQSQIESFISLCVASSSYSFNASHSAAYAYIGFLCQYLKVHYPLEWWTSVLQNSKAEDLEINARYCRDFLLSPSINESDLDFYILDGRREKIVYPLSRVKGVKTAGETIVSYRPYASFEDFIERVPRNKAMAEAENLTTGKVGKGVVSALIWAGAFDELCGVKGVLDRIGVYRRYLDLREIRGKARQEEEEKLPRDEFEVLMRQNASLPLNSADFSGLIARKQNVQILDLAKLGKQRDRTYVRVAGYVQEARRHKDKNKNDMMFLTLVDKSNAVSVTVFSDLYEKKKDILKEGSVLLAGGNISDFKGRRSIAASDIVAFGEVEIEKEEKSPTQTND